MEYLGFIEIYFVDIFSFWLGGGVLKEIVGENILRGPQSELAEI